jgi:hypothetical protein
VTSSNRTTNVLAALAIAAMSRSTAVQAESAVALVVVNTGVPLTRMRAVSPFASVSQRWNCSRSPCAPLVGMVGDCSQLLTLFA